MPERAIELLSENPFWSVRALTDGLDVAFTTAQRSIDWIEALARSRWRRVNGAIACTASLLFWMCS